MTTWKNGEDGRRAIVLDGASDGGMQIRLTLTIVRQPAQDVGPTWDVSLDGLKLFAVDAPDAGEAEVLALARLNVWADGIGSIIYHLTKSKTPLRPVRCAWCDYVGHSVVPDGVGDGLQGDNVASSVGRGSGDTTPNGKFVYDVDTWYVFGGYGSGGFDLSLFRFTKNHPTDPADPVCDGCIQKRIDAGDLEKLSDQYIADPPSDEPTP